MRPLMFFVPPNVPRLCCVAPTVNGTDNKPQSNAAAHCFNFPLLRDFSVAMDLYLFGFWGPRQQPVQHSLRSIGRQGLSCVRSIVYQNSSGRVKRLPACARRLLLAVVMVVSITTFPFPCEARAYPTSEASRRRRCSSRGAGYTAEPLPASH